MTKKTNQANGAETMKQGSNLVPAQSSLPLEALVPGCSRDTTVSATVEAQDEED